jgi:GT2 family glycosyltransferase
MLEHTLIVEEFASLGVLWATEYGCKHIHKHKPPGYSSSVNIGLEYAKEHGYTHVVTVNQDIEFTRPVLSAFIRGFRYGDIVGGLLYYPTGRIQSAGFWYRGDCLPVEYEKRLPANSARLYKEERFVGGVTGALQGFSLECGLYDETFALGYEDVWFCIQALMADRKVFYTPTIEAVHVESATRGRFPTQAEISSLNRLEILSKDIDARVLNAKVGEYNKTHEQ